MQSRVKEADAQRRNAREKLWTQISGLVVRAVKCLEDQ
jgi:hypothetical protein